MIIKLRLTIVQAGRAIKTQIEVQGGAVYLNAYARNMHITNNIIRSNGGSYGAIRIGTPYLVAPDDPNQHNTDVVIAHNRILANGGRVLNVTALGRTVGEAQARAYAARERECSPST